MLDATITCPRELTLGQVTGLLYVLDGIVGGEQFDITYSSGARDYIYDLMIDGLTGLGFEPNQIRSIRFQPHEVTAEMYEHRDGKVFKREGSDEPAMLTVHIPVVQPGRESLADRYRVDVLS